MGREMVHNFQGKDENTQRNLYFLLLKTSLWKRSRTFFRTVYPKKHVTTHPVYMIFVNELTQSSVSLTHKSNKIAKALFNS